MKPGRIARVLILIFLSCLAVVGGIMYYRLGFYKDVEMHGVQKLSFKFLYAEHIGPYHKIVPLIQKVEIIAKDNDILCRQTYGEYLDNPELVDPDRLRSHVGCVLQSHQKVDAELLKQNNILLETKPEKEYIKLTFDGSPAIGPMKVYPAAQEWAMKNSRELEEASIEIYNIYESGKKVVTEFYFALKK